MSAPHADAKDTPLIRATGITKIYGASKALDEAVLEVRAGEVHGLVGANGAGKSTMIKILAGLERSSSGELQVDGNLTQLRTPEESTEVGFSFIHQELNLIPGFSILQNLVLGTRLAQRGPFLSLDRAEAQAKSVCTRLGIAHKLTTKVAELPVPEQWLVCIARALMQDARLVVMDEPTASLSASEADRLFDIVRGLREDGVAVLYVSHRLAEVIDLCDRVTVFRNGKTVAGYEHDELNVDILVTAIAGTSVLPVAKGEQAAKTRPVFSVSGLESGRAVKRVDLTIHEGEVLGIAGLVGAGRSELLHCIYGDRPVDAGTMELDQRPYQPKDTAQAIRNGVALVPEERKSEGVVLERSTIFNLNLPHLTDLRSPALLGLVDLRRGAKRAKQAIEDFVIKVPDPRAPIASLSGGNQQKVVLARWLLSDPPKLLLLDEPSRGVDVGARSEIYSRIRQLADGGLATIVVSSEFAELSVCDRVLVMVEGQIVEEVHGDDINEERLVSLCYQHQKPQEGDPQ